MQANRAMFVAGVFVTILLSTWTARSAQPETKQPAPPRPGGAFVSPEVQADGKITFRLRAQRRKRSP